MYIIHADDHSSKKENEGLLRKTIVNLAKLTKSAKLSIIFYVFALLSLIGGIALAIAFMPGDPGEGRSWKMIAYSPSITAFAVGFLQASVLTAIGQALTYLKKIEYNTRKGGVQNQMEYQETL